jgi:hypothetical protein
MALAHNVHRTHDQEIGHLAGLGALGGFFGVSAAVTLLGVLLGLALGAALALGTFVGLFGGLGFGAMMGASLAANREPVVEHERTPRST